jgi:hypothetical protein
MLVLESQEDTLFFNRYYQQLSSIRQLGIDYKILWDGFCTLSHISPKKPWLLSKKEIKILNQLSDEQIFQTLGNAVSRTFKGNYEGEGI